MWTSTTQVMVFTLMLSMAWAGSPRCDVDGLSPRDAVFLGETIYLVADLDGPEQCPNVQYAYVFAPYYTEDDVFEVEEHVKENGRVSSTLKKCWTTTHGCCPKAENYGYAIARNDRFVVMYTTTTNAIEVYAFSPIGMLQEKDYALINNMMEKCPGFKVEDFCKYEASIFF